MAPQRKQIRDGGSAGKTGRLPARSGAFAGWLAVSGMGIGFALWSAATVAGVYSTASSLSAAPHLASLGAPSRIALAEPRAVPAAEIRAKVDVLVARERARQMRLASTVVQDGKSVRLAVLAPQPAPAPQRAAAPLKERFAAAQARHGMPEPARFGPRSAEPERASRLALALAGSPQVRLDYALAAPPEPDAASRNIVLASLEFTLPDDGGDGPDGQARDFAAMPDNAPLPAFRPQIERPAQREEQRSQPDAEPAPRIAKRPEPHQPVMAFARPDNPEPGGIARAFKDLFSGRPSTGPAARDGVAVYDISAARVYMPDGSVLEAHSGIGHMADDPRYVDQKMRGPTPPGTYNLSMRESLFYGVEALRMTPVSGKVGYNRTGILAHSYLLRGGRAESHGCVAFKDYPKFLHAFKKGKIRRLVVVPGGSRSSNAVARNGSTG
ncbi:hypothetical protein ATER59S_02555 [Aquamicrobium terrae]